MDLPKLRQETEEKLTESGDEQTARRALEQFLNAFGDGHLSIECPRSDASRFPAARGIGNSRTSVQCSRLGYKSSTNAGIDFSLLPGFTAVPSTGSELFSGGLPTLQNGSKLGLIRIASSSEREFTRKRFGKCT
jgi:hypothetical protein